MVPIQYTVCIDYYYSYLLIQADFKTMPVINFWATRQEEYSELSRTFPEFLSQQYTYVIMGFPHIKIKSHSNNTLNNNYLNDGR